MRNNEQRNRINLCCHSLWMVDGSIHRFFRLRIIWSSMSQKPSEYPLWRGCLLWSYAPCEVKKEVRTNSRWVISSTKRWILWLWHLYEPFIELTVNWESPKTYRENIFFSITKTIRSLRAINYTKLWVPSPKPILMRKWCCSSFWSNAPPPPILDCLRKHHQRKPMVEIC